ncbi:NEUR3 protein, partial [Climacteris rufus]|nr:NEUR3 protein [Climacteris rufus]
VGPGHGVQLDSGRLVVPAYTYYVHGCLCGAVRLPCSTRQHSLVFYSDDGGRRWHKGALLGGERTGECQVAEIGGAERPPAWLLYSHPTDPRRRRDLGVYVNPSPLDGEGWRRPWVLRAGPAGYSDLAVCPGRLFGCLFECGASSACEEIAFCLFTLDAPGDQNLKAT